MKYLYFTGRVESKHYLFLSSGTVRNIQSGIPYLLKFLKLAWRTQALFPWNSMQRITSGLCLSQAELQSNWRMEKCCQRPSCMLPSPTVSSLSGKRLVSQMAEPQLNSPRLPGGPRCPEHPRSTPAWPQSRPRAQQPLHRTPQLSALMRITRHRHSLRCV